MSRRKLVTIAAVLAAAIVVAIVWRFAGVFLRDVFFEPLARELDGLRRAIAGLPGLVVWLSALAIATVVAVRAMVRDSVILRPRRVRRPRPREETEFQRLARSLAKTRSVNAARHLAGEFIRMSAMLVAQEQGIPVEAAARAIRLGTVTLPPEVENALRTGASAARGSARGDVEQSYEEAIAVLERSVEGGIFPCS